MPRSPACGRTRPSASAPWPASWPTGSPSRQRAVTPSSTSSGAAASGEERLPGGVLGGRIGGDFHCLGVFVVFVLFVEVARLDVGVLVAGVLRRAGELFHL